MKSKQTNLYDELESLTICLCSLNVKSIPKVYFCNDSVRL